MRRGFILAFWVALAFLGVLPAAQADPLSELKEQMRLMEERHQRDMGTMKKRVEALERELHSKGEETRAAAQGSPLEERLSYLETQMEKSSQPGNFRVSWKDGIRFQTEDKVFKFKLGGRIFADAAFMDEDEDLAQIKGEAEDAVEFRRTRLFFGGTLYSTIDYKMEYEFAAGTPEFKDVYMAFRELPFVDTLRVGHFKEPLSLEEQTSSKYITFMERALPNELLPGRNTGVMILPSVHERVTLAFGIFRETDDQGQRGSQEGGEYNYTTRLTGLPLYEDDGRLLLHLGASYSHRNPHDSVRFRARPEAHLAPRFVDTGTLSSHDVNLYGFEAAWVHGPLSLQTEYMYAGVDRAGTSDPHFYGFYVYVSYFLTGERRPYKVEDAEFDRVKPRHNFMDEDYGMGAWEAGVRYSQLDLDDSNVGGGELQDITFGVNWYWNPHTRLMWNYIFADQKPIGEAHIFQTRFQIDF